MAAIERAAGDDRVVGLVARVGNAGMGLARTQELRDAVRAFRRSGKPAYAFAESFGDFGPGNAAYYLATAFEKIYLQPSGDVGLTGLLAEGYFLKGTLEKLDVRYRVSQREEYKGIRERFTDSGFTAAQREALSRILESLTEQLTAGIAEGRGLSRDEVRELMQRAPFPAREALEAKLVDALLYRDEVNEVVREALGADVAFLSLSGYRHRLEPKDGEPATVALIYGLGTVHGGSSSRRAFTGRHSMGSDSIARAFRRAADDDEVKAIIFRIDSTGRLLRGRGRDPARGVAGAPARQAGDRIHGRRRGLGRLLRRRSRQPDRRATRDPHRLHRGGGRKGGDQGPVRQARGVLGPHGRQQQRDLLERGSGL